MNQSRRIAAVAATLTLAGAGLALTGCNGGGSSNHLSQFRSDPTPQMASRGLRQDDIDNRSTIVNDHNMRMLYDDLRRAFLLDRPSRLSRPAIY